ncbi:response regulator transcription factor [Bacillus sp. WMMC1349]|nr:response regulator transcription factor [Bacillus sp. WMMC1349]
MLVKRSLTNEGYHVMTVFNGESVLEALEQNPFDLLILDLMLPNINGLDILEKVRQTNNIPILILSAKDSERDKVLGLNLGADDYLAKPFRVGELLARVKALLRRFLYLNEAHSSPTDTILRYGNIELNCDHHTCQVAGKNVELTAKEFLIFELLMKHPLKVFSKSQIFNIVWGQDYYTDDNTVTVHVNRLRSKIEANPSKPKYIQTVWGIGYRIAGDNKQ